MRLGKVAQLSTLILIFTVYVKTQNVEDKCDFSGFKILTISHFLLNSVIKEVKPKYPPAAKFVNAQGKVEVKILVDKKGNVKDACVVSGHPLLRTAAKNAALKWKFKENFGFSTKSKSRYKYLQETLTFIFRL